MILIYKGLKDSPVDFSTLKSHSGFIINNYAYSVVGGFRGNIDKIIIGPLLGFMILGNYTLALQFIVLLAVIPQIVFKYTLPEDSTGKPTGKIKILTIIVSFFIMLISWFNLG